MDFLSSVSTMFSSEDQAVPVVESEWERAALEDGTVYYTNRTKNESSWAIPDGWHEVPGSNYLAKVSREAELVDMSSGPTSGIGAQDVELDMGSGGGHYYKPAEHHVAVEEEDPYKAAMGRLISTTKSEYQVVGTNTQIVNVNLVPGDQIRCQPKVLMHMDPKVETHTFCYCSCRRYLSAESQFATDYRNPGSTPVVVGLAVNVPGGKIVPIDLDDPMIAGSLKCRKGAWMATLGEAEISSSFDFRLATCCCTGQGLSQQTITGRGTVFLVGGGTVMRREIKRHEKIVLDDENLLAWTGTVGYTARSAFERCRDLCCDCSGEGIFNYVIDGGDAGGLIFVHSMPFEKYKEAIAPSIFGTSSSSAARST